EHSKFRQLHNLIYSLINQAREQLKQGVPLAELAVNLGFSDQSHFHKAFKAHTGVTPRQFQLAAAQ
ncbi:helix-turn-helix domain-containing protein, partial [Acinetobacter baumannii]|uniref:helix-turn-helix domain-containing protein n=4 Tax=Acinetobacter baumannii TaxID=470 RepID=UPI003D7F2BF5